VHVAYESSVEGRKERSFKVGKPRLWDIGKGELYRLEVLGETFTYGIRDFRFDADKGFFINGRRVQLKGVDLHSDMGPLGMAFDRDAMKRQLLIMKDMGFNALRTSHNAMDPYVLQLCDEMGVFVWNECFDKWDGTAGRRSDENLEEYVIRNLRQFVRRDRNHPSVFCWSIGNEIGAPLQDGKPTGMTDDRFRAFRAAIRELDTTRPVTVGCCGGLGKVDFSLLDMTGWNYGANYRHMKLKYPAMPVLYSESASAVSEYGFYELPPAASKTDYARTTLQVGSYDHNAAPWSDIPDVEFDRMERDPFCGGEFVWTGIDYLGEPTPIAPGKGFGITNANAQCARSSYFGAVDLCGIPKDRFWLYRSWWNRDADTIHILPHWNWAGREGQNVPVYVYTSGDEAELFLNGRSLGRRRKTSSSARMNLAAGCAASASSEEHKGGKLVHPAIDALDGMGDTRWCAQGGATGQWWQVDLGKVVRFDRFTLQPEMSQERYGYTVTLSDDGTTSR
jgi:beta-galactosidase